MTALRVGVLHWKSSCYIFFQIVHSYLSHIIWFLKEEYPETVLILLLALIWVSKG
jgi:hypothetical protein